MKPVQHFDKALGVPRTDNLGRSPKRQNQQLLLDALHLHTITSYLGATAAQPPGGTHSHESVPSWGRRSHLLLSRVKITPHRSSYHPGHEITAALPDRLCYVAAVLPEHCLRSKAMSFFTLKVHAIGLMDPFCVTSCFGQWTVLLRIHQIEIIFCHPTKQLHTLRRRR